MKRKQLIVQTVFAFILFMMPTIALEPNDESVYRVTDFFAYYTQCKLLVSKPGSDVYSEGPLMSEAARMFPPLKGHLYLVGEPPVSLTFLLPLSLIPPIYSLWTYKTILVLTAATSIAILTQLFELKERQYLLTCILVSLSGPLWESTRVGKPGLIVLFALTVCLWALKNQKPLHAAIAFLPWTFKPQLTIPFLCAIVGAKQFKFIICLVAATAILALVTLPLFGITNYQAWLAVVKYGTQHPELNSPSLHATVRAQLMLMHVPDPVVQIVALSSFALAQAVSFLVGWRLRAAKHLVMWCTLCMPLGILCSPYCHNYDLVLLIPSVIAFCKLPGLAAVARTPRIAILAMVFLCVLVFEMPFYTRIHYDMLQKGLLTISPLFCSLSILSLIFVTMAFRETKSSSAAAIID